MNPNILIREATEKEIPKVVEITNQAFNAPYKENGLHLVYNEPTEGLLREFDQGKVKVLVALVGEEMVGVARYGVHQGKFTPWGKEEKKIIELKKIAVLKEWRSKGVAAKLVRQIEKLIGATDTEAIVLDCMVENDLVPFYEKLGYQKFKTIEHNGHHDAYMFKVIK